MTDSGATPGGDLVDLLDGVVKLAPVAMVIADRQGQFLAANRQWHELGETCLAGAPAQDRWTDCLEPSSRRRLVQQIEQCALTGESATLELEMVSESGSRWSRWWLHRRLIEETPVVVLVAVDVHEDVVQRDDLRELATRDDLTGLVNRRFFMETVDQALRRLERSPAPLGLLYIDLDSFKEVNDRAGHAVGDRVLNAVANRLQTAVRGADVVGRIGGDEFAMLLERLQSPGEAAIIARRVQEALSGSVEVDGRQWPLSASVGIALTEGPGESAADLLARADEAMYAAKRSRGVGRPRAETLDGDSPSEAAPAGEPPRPVGGGEGPAVASGTTVTEPSPAPPPAAVAAADTPRSRIDAADLHRLRDGMDTIRQSLEVLLQGMDQQPS